MRAKTNIHTQGWLSLSHIINYQLVYRVFGPDVVPVHVFYLPRRQHFYITTSISLDL